MNHFCKCSKTTWVGLCVAFLISYSFSAYAQQSTLLAQRISIKTGHITVAEALTELGRHANCSFAYSDDLIDRDREVSLNYRSTTLASILRRSFGITAGRLLVQGDVIHIRAAPPNARPVITGAPPQDTTRIARSYDLDPVVVTGQYRPQSLNKSIYRVEVIDKRTIDNMAVTNVGELLKQQLNIDIENQSGIGRSKIRVLGLNSQYTKILMDNIPIAGDENMGNDVDLSTISMDDVEQVEIIRGAMGVEYGANSIAGVINIITKKRAANGTDVSLDIQEETVANEYNLRFDDNAKGRHVQRLNASHNLNKYLSVGGSLSRDKFNGLWGEYDGAGLITEPIGRFPVTTRGYDWSPKESWNSNLYASFSTARLSVFYKFNHFRSNLTQFGRQAENFLLKAEDVYVNAAINNDYRNTRYNHHLNLRGDFWKNAYFSLDASLQKNGLEHRRRAVNLFDNSTIHPINGLPGNTRLKPQDWMEYYESEGFYSKGTLLKPIVHGKLDFNLGYEVDRTTGNQGYTNTFADVVLGEPQQHTITTGGAYASAEWQVSPRMMVRPGFRMNFSDKRNMRTNESLTARYRLNDRNDLRLILGTSTRFPNFQEMYMYFVDAIHEYVGNPDLRPEYGQSAELQWGHRREVSSGVYLQTSVGAMFQYIQDRIVNVTYQSEREGVMTGTNTFTNENNYHGLSSQLDARLVSDRFHFSVAGSLVGYRGSDDASVTEYSKFLINSQANAQATYIFPGGIRAALFYRYVGKQPQYVFLPKSAPGADLQVTDYYKVLTETEPYHNLDFNVAKTFFGKKLDVRAGVRNLLGVTDITYTMVNPPDHIVDREAGTLRLYYGHTYFVKLTYRFLTSKK